MSKRKKFILNFIILIVALVFIMGFIFEFRFTPLGVHKALEKKAYYGPSEIINTIKDKNEVINICKYGDYYSIDEAEKNKFGLWHPSGNQPHYVVENKKDKPLTVNPYYRGKPIDDKVYKWNIWGVINDNRIKDIRLVIMDEGNIKVLEENNIKDDTYIFRWESNIENYEDNNLMIIGLDENENIIYKVNYRGEEYK